MNRWMVMTALSFGSGIALAASAPLASPSSGFHLAPRVHVDERITDVYAKSVSWFGAGLKGHVTRFSGTSTYTITAAGSDAIVFDEQDRGDGQPPSPVVHGAKVLADRNTWCYNGRCRTNDQTSGVFFIPLLWGAAPEHLQPGSTWNAKIDQPWEIGPKGTERVRVVRTDPLDGGITLVRHGAGTGPSSDELRWVRAKHPIEITTLDGKHVAVTLHPGKATWSGYTTVRRGVIVGDEIMLTQQVQFVARDGRSWDAELRVYTLLNLASDVTAATR